MKTQGKSIIVQIIATVLLVLGSTSSLLTPSQMAIAGIVTAALTLIMNTFFPSGELVKGWTLVLWATNLGAAILQIVNMTSTVVFIPPAVINYLTVGINTLIMIIAKNYGKGAMIGVTPILLLMVLCTYTQAQDNLVSAEKIIPIPCPANLSLASKQFDTICRSENIVYTIYNYQHKAVVNITDWLFRVQSVNQWYSQPGIGGRLDGMGVFLQDVIGENPPSGTGTSGDLIENEMSKPLSFNIHTSYKINLDSTVTVTSKITSLKKNASVTLRYISYIQDADLYPNEFRQFVTPWSGVTLPKCRAGASKTYKTTVRVAPYLNSKKFIIVGQVADSNGTMYNHQIFVSSQTN